MPEKPRSGPTLIQHPVGVLLSILAVSFICCLSLLSYLVRYLLEG